MVGKSGKAVKRGPPPQSTTLSTTAASMGDEEEEGCIEEEPVPPPAKKQNTGRDWPQEGGYRGGGPGGGGPPYFDRGGDRRDAYPPHRQDIGRGGWSDPKHRPGPGGGGPHGRDSPGPRRMDDRFDSRPPYASGPRGPGPDRRPRDGRGPDMGSGGRGGPPPGGPPPGFRGDDWNRRGPPAPGYYADRGPDPRDRRGPPPPMYDRDRDRERPQEGRGGGRSPMDVVRPLEYEHERGDKKRDRGPPLPYRALPAPEEMDLLARTRDMGSGRTGPGLMFGRRGEGGPPPGRNAQDPGAVRGPGPGRRGGAQGLPGPRNGDLKSGKTNTPGDAVNGPSQKRSKEMLTDKDVYDQVQLQVMLLEYKSTMACLDIGLKAKVNPVNIPFEQASTPQNRDRDRGRDGDGPKKGPPFVDARGPPIGGKGGYRAGPGGGGPSDKGGSCRGAPGLGSDRGDRPLYAAAEGRVGHVDRDRDMGTPEGYKGVGPPKGGTRGRPPHVGNPYGDYGGYGRA